jgi:hypothetical protein
VGCITWEKRVLPCPNTGTVGSTSEGSLVRLLPLTIGACTHGANPCLASQHRAISAVVLSSCLVVWGTSEQVMRAIHAALPLMIAFSVVSQA